jgi:hypothetical protein
MVFARGPTVQNQTKLGHFSLPAGVRLSLRESKRKTTTEKLYNASKRKEKNKK